MKTMFLTVGVILILGGTKSVLDPRASLVSMGGNRYNPTVSYQEISKDNTSYLGYATIGLGIIAMIAGYKSKAQFIPPPKVKLDEPDNSNVDE